jgi:threonine aldolase
VAPPGSVDVDRVQTNMVIFDAQTSGLSPAGVVEALRSEGVLAGLNLPGPVVRFVTHNDVAGQDVDRAVSAFAGSLKALR